MLDPYVKVLVPFKAIEYDECLYTISFHPLSLLNMVDPYTEALSTL